MDVSKKGLNEGAEEITTAEAPAREGSELLQEVASLTGLPPDWVHEELGQILKTSGHENPANVGLEELRAAMLKYLDEMQSQLAEQEAADLAALEAMAIPSSTLNH